MRETRLSPDQLVLPLFCTPGKGVRTPISSMPGVARLSPDLCAAAAKEAKSLGLGGVILFGIPATKDDRGTSGIVADGIIPTAIKAIKDAVPELAVITDVCLCEYTDHGHCGILRDGEVDNDATLPLLAAQAVAHAEHEGGKEEYGTQVFGDRKGKATEADDQYDESRLHRATQRPPAHGELSDRGGDKQERHDQTCGEVPLNAEKVPRERGP